MRRGPTRSETREARSEKGEARSEKSNADAIVKLPAEIYLLGV